MYRKNKKYKKSIDVSKKDELFQDAMETVAESKDPALAEDLMRSIMEMEDKELFAAMLYTCYELIKPDVALEVAWRSDLIEFVMPYFIQFVKDLSTRVETVQKSTDDIKKKDEKAQKEKLDQPLAMNVEMMFPTNQSTMPALMPSAPMPNPMGLGGNMGGGMGGFNPMGNQQPGMNQFGGQF